MTSSNRPRHWRLTSKRALVNLGIKEQESKTSQNFAEEICARSLYCSLRRLVNSSNSHNPQAPFLRITAQAPHANGVADRVRRSFKINLDGNLFGPLNPLGRNARRRQTKSIARPLARVYGFKSRNDCFLLCFVVQSTARKPASH